MKYRDIISFSIFYVVLMTSCVMFTSPPDNKGFYEITSLYDLEGKYSNEGEASNLHGGNPYLSQFIWNSDITLNHDQIDTIEVKALNVKTILVNAYIKNDIRKSATFVEGTDFELNNGKLTLTREAGVYQEGSIIVGPYYENIEIGIDKRGDGKYRQKYLVAGLAYLVLPVAVGGRDDFRFKRLDNVNR
jgi:hypothetical protein